MLLAVAGNMKPSFRGIGGVTLAFCLTGCFANTGDEADSENYDETSEAITTLETQRCGFEANHWAEGRLHVTPKRIVGYSIRYLQANSVSWKLGSKNNEHLRKPAED